MEESSIDANNGHNGLEITPQIRSYLAESAKWGKFISIVGLILMVFLILGGIIMSFFMGSMLSELGGDSTIGGPAVTGFIGLMYVLIASLNAIPLLFLYRFSKKMQIALDQDDQKSLAEGFRNQKSLYKFVGILILAIIAIYVAVFIISMLGLSMI